MLRRSVGGSLALQNLRKEQGTLDGLSGQPAVGGYFLGRWGATERKLQGSGTRQHRWKRDGRSPGRLITDDVAVLLEPREDRVDLLGRNRKRADGFGYAIERDDLRVGIEERAHSSEKVRAEHGFEAYARAAQKDNGSDLGGNHEPLETMRAAVLREEESEDAALRDAGARVVPSVGSQKKRCEPRPADTTRRDSRRRAFPRSRIDTEREQRRAFERRCVTPSRSFGPCGLGDHGARRGPSHGRLEQHDGRDASERLAAVARSRGAGPESLIALAARLRVDHVAVEPGGTTDHRAVQALRRTAARRRAHIPETARRCTGTVSQTRAPGVARARGIAFAIGAAAAVRDAPIAAVANEDAHRAAIRKRARLTLVVDAPASVPTIAIGDALAAATRRADTQATCGAVRERGAAIA